MKTLAALACIVVISVAVVSADSRIEYKATEGGGASFGTILIGQGKIRSDADATTSVIIDPTAGTTTIIDHSRKTFTRITRADVQGVVKQMEQMMAGIPPEMLAMVQGRMGGRGGEQPATVDTGERATVAGRSCRMFRTTLRGAVTGEQCMADPSVIDIPGADRATLTAAIAWSKELADTLAKSPMGRFADSSPFRGGLVPLRTTTIVGGARRTSEFVGVTTAALDAGLFRDPEGYKAEPLPTMRGRGMASGR